VKSLKIIFMGTPDFSVPCLEMLVNSCDKGYEVVAVVTQPDKPVGRKQNVLQYTDVKKAALEHGIKTVLQPEKVRTQEFTDTIRDLSPDLIITAAYGRIIPKEILEIPTLGCINVHGSLLPKYRGAAPIQWAIINGDRVTGITTMFMDVGIDTGDMLLKREVPISEDMTYRELYEKLRELGADVLKDTLMQLEEGTLKRIPQDHQEATIFPMMKKEMGLIDWSKSAWEVHNLVRGTDPWPGAFTFYKGERLKIWKTSLIKSDEPYLAAKPGSICKITKDSLVVATGNGFLKITEIQFESCRKMSALECGHNMDEGEILG
jgi:methionyl-tRNA formyltransferase